MTGVGRTELELMYLDARSRLDLLHEAIEKARKERDSYLRNLNDVQARCTALLEEMRRLKETIRSMNVMGEL